MKSIDSPPMRVSSRTWPWACGLVLIVFVVFGAAARFGFLHWDDDRQVLENPQRQSAFLARRAGVVAGAYWRLYIPVSYTVLAVEAAIAEGVDPGSGLSELRRPSSMPAISTPCGLTVLVFVLLRRLLDLHQRSPSRSAAM